MVTAESFQYKDDFGITITTYSFLPENPKAVVQISHGIGEHAKRYTDFANFLAQNGYAVYADDHRGHGETGRQQHLGDLSMLGRLGPGGLLATEKAIINLTEIIRSKHIDLPLTYFGHSWGSLMGQRIINENNIFDSIVLSGSSYRMPGFMESGDLNKNHRHLGSTGFEWLTRDEDKVQEFVADELTFAADILKLFGVRDALRLFGTPSAGVGDRPMLIMSGTDDPLAKKDSLERLAAAYKNRGATDLTLKLFQDGRHEMLNEINRDEVYRFVLEWLNSKTQRSNDKTETAK